MLWTDGSLEALLEKGSIGLVARLFLARVMFILLFVAAGCSLAGQGGTGSGVTEATPWAMWTETPRVHDLPAYVPQAASPTATLLPTPTPTEVVFDVGDDLTIKYLRSLEISGSQITFEQELAPTYYYRRHIVSYISEGSKIYGLLTVPILAIPETGFKAIVFNHGYIPPASYRTTERYTAYVDYLARNGFVVFKIDLRGHGNSEGEASGSYFSPGYTIDAIAALKSLQTLDIIDPEGIGMWGHSMAGNLVLRAMLIEPDIKAGVIWAGAVYSYDDFAQYGIDDNTYRPPATPDGDDRPRRSQQIFDSYGRPGSGHPYWQAVSLTANLDWLQSPLQLHHSQDDPVVNIGYSQGLAAGLQERGKEYEYYIYPSGGHNLVSPYFDQAMLRTVEFFRENL
jgi:dipeptidyl aminopeptidase/acylaminoacyl peptidase